LLSISKEKGIKELFYDYQLVWFDYTLFLVSFVSSGSKIRWEEL